MKLLKQEKETKSEVAGHLYVLPSFRSSPNSLGSARVRELRVPLLPLVVCTSSIYLSIYLIYI